MGKVTDRPLSAAPGDLVPHQLYPALHSSAVPRLAASPRLLPIGAPQPPPYVGCTSARRAFSRLRHRLVAVPGVEQQLGPRSTVFRFLYRSLSKPDGRPPCEPAKRVSTLARAVSGISQNANDAGCRPTAFQGPTLGSLLTKFRSCPPI